MMNKPIILAICGKSCSGKDSLKYWLVKELDAHGMISDTTRCPRAKERNGVDYHFISRREFESKIFDNEYLEYTEFNNWCYGTPQSEVQEGINVGIFNAQGIKSLISQQNKYTVIPILLDKVPIKTRLARSIYREHQWKMEYLKRVWRDYKDFKDIRDVLHEFDNWIILENIDGVVAKTKVIKEVLQAGNFG